MLKRALLGAALFAALPALAQAPRNHQETGDSPTLRLHAGDPVHGRRWGEAAFAEARRQGRPILLSIGYAACHRCHVMQRQSFADPATARLIKVLFLPALVDREARPDVVSLYQGAMMLIRRPTGWPPTVFATPDPKPFWGGGHFPAKPPPRRSPTCCAASPRSTSPGAGISPATPPPSPRPSSG